MVIGRKRSNWVSDMRGALQDPQLAEGGQVFGDGIEQLEAPFLVQGHEGRAHHRLGHRIDAEDRIRGQRGPALTLLPADLLEVDHAAAPRQHGAQAGIAFPVHVGLHDGLDARQALGAAAHAFRRLDYTFHGFLHIVIMDQAQGE